MAPIPQHINTSPPQTCGGDRKGERGKTYTRTVKVLAWRTIKHLAPHSQKHGRIIEPVEGEECAWRVGLEDDWRGGFGDVCRSRGPPAEVDQVGEEGDEDEVDGREYGGTGVGLVRWFAVAGGQGR